MPKILVREARAQVLAASRPGRTLSGRRRKFRDTRLAACELEPDDAPEVAAEGGNGQPAGIGLNGPPPDLAADILWGAAEIARFVLGDPSRVKDVYHYLNKVAPDRRIPSFRIGSLICARRSTIMRWIEAQEASRTTER